MVKYKKDLVSIVISYYNLGKYIQETVKSIINQSYLTLEIILVNDGSNDKKSLKILDELKKKYSNQIIFIDQNNKGLSNARNTGINASNGKYICCMDADDKIDPFYIEKLHKALINNNKIGVASPWVELFGEEKYIWKTSEMTPKTALVNNTICGSSLFQKKCWEKVGGYDEKMKLGYEDWDFWISITKIGYKSTIVPEALFKYRIRDNSMLKNSNIKRIEILNYLFSKHSDILKKNGKEIYLEKEKEVFYLRNQVIALQKNLNKVENSEKNLKQEKGELLSNYKELFFNYSNVVNSKKWKLIYKIDQYIKHILSKNLFIKKIAKFCFNKAKVIYHFTKDFIRITKERINELKRKKIVIQNKAWTNDKPLISVVIPSFNYGKYINQAIDSVLNQTFSNFEIIIIDSSTDQDSINVLKKINHNKIKIFFREGKHLVGDNRNYGISKSRGKYICCLDADDKIKETYLEKALYLLESEHLDIVSTSLKMFDQDDKTFYQINQPNIKQMLNANHIFTVAVFKKSFWKKANGYYDFNEEKNYIYEDWDFWVRCIALGARVKNIVEPLMLYRIHGLSLSNRPDTLDIQEQSEIIKKHNKKLLTKKNINDSLKTNTYKYIVKNPLINLENKEYEPSKILFAIPYTILGGADKVFLQLLSTFKKLKLFPSIFTTEPIPNKAKNTMEEYEKITSKIYDLPRFIKNQKDWLNFILFFIKTRNIKYIYLANSHYFYKILPDIKKAFPEIKVIDHHFNTNVHFSHNRKYSKYIDHSVTESQFVIEEFVKKYKENPKNISLIANGIDTTHLFNPNSYEKLKRPKLLPKDKKIISFIGRISPEKGPDLFLKIANEFKDNRNLLFVIAGPGPINDYINKKQLSDKFNNVLYLGVINSAELLYFTDILLLPSIIDGRPIVVLEAMSMNKMVIASKIGSLPQLIKDKKTGLLCEPSNINQFVESINWTLNNPELSKKIGNNARKFAVDNLDQKNLDETYQKLFQRVENKII